MSNYLQAKWKVVFLFYLGIIASVGALAQERKVTGKVIDAETKETVIGASVRVKGGTIGTLTDVNGSFSLNVPEGASTLSITYLGYTSVDVSVNFFYPYYN